MQSITSSTIPVSTDGNHSSESLRSCLKQANGETKGGRITFKSHIDVREFWHGENKKNGSHSNLVVRALPVHDFFVTGEFEDKPTEPLYIDGWFEVANFLLKKHLEYTHSNIRAHFEQQDIDPNPLIERFRQILGHMAKNECSGVSVTPIKNYWLKSNEPTMGQLRFIMMSLLPLDNAERIAYFNRPEFYIQNPETPEMKLDVTIGSCKGYTREEYWNDVKSNAAIATPEPMDTIAPVPEPASASAVEPTPEPMLESEPEPMMLESKPTPTTSLDDVDEMTEAARIIVAMMQQITHTSTCGIKRLNRRRIGKGIPFMIGARKKYAASRR